MARGAEAGVDEGVGVAIEDFDIGGVSEGNCAQEGEVVYAVASVGGGVAVGVEA